MQVQSTLTPQTGQERDIRLAILNLIKRVR